MRWTDALKASKRCASFIVFIFFVVLFPRPAFPQDEETARKHYEQAVDLFNEGRYAEALGEFRASYEAFPVWKVHYYIGLTLKELSDFIEAEKELKAFLEEGGKNVPGDKKDEVKAILAQLPGSIGTFDIVVDEAGASVLVGGVLAGETPLVKPVRKNAGTYQIEVKKAGFKDFVTTANAKGGKTVTVKVKLEKAAETSQGDIGDGSAAPLSGVDAKNGKKTRGASPMKISGAALLGLGAFGLLVGTATGGAAIETGKELDDQCIDGWCDPMYSGKIDKMNSLAWSSDVFLCLGVAAAVAGAVLLVMDKKRESKTLSKVSISPGGPSGLTLKWSY